MNTDDNVLIEENGLYCVYKHTNNKNGKIYYGMAQNCLNRWNNGFGYSSNQMFWNDIVAYGWNNFKHEIIVKNINKDTASELEGLLIQETESYLPENGYNQNFKDFIFEEISVGSEDDFDGINRVKRRGRGGSPVIYLGKFYPTIKSFSIENEEDEVVVSQGLNPNCPRRLPNRLLSNGLRYATEEEIQEYENTMI